MLDPIPHQINLVQIASEELIYDVKYYGYGTGVHPMALILIDAHLSPSP